MSQYHTPLPPFPSHLTNMQDFRDTYSWPCQQVPVLPKRVASLPQGSFFGPGNGSKQESSFYQRSAARREADHQFEACTYLAGTLLHIQSLLCSKTDAVIYEQHFSGVAP